MAQHQVRRVPVVNDENRLVGIISQADIALRADSEQHTAQLVENVSRPKFQVQEVPTGFE
jgi:CBS domain-containing protein